MIGDLNPTGSSDDGLGIDMAMLGGTLYFTPDDGSRGSELWKVAP